MSGEKRYLEEMGRKLDESIARVRTLPNNGDYENLYQLLLGLISAEKELRISCEIGSRYNVIRTQLQFLLERVEKEIKVREGEKAADQAIHAESLKSDEMLVYVYLYNTQGMILKTWQKLLTEDALFEHSVNRPIYANKDEVLKVIDAKSDRAQHAYLEVVVKRIDIMTLSYPAMHDQYGYTLLRLKQGSLKTENIRTFFHNGKVYHLENHELIIS